MKQEGLNFEEPRPAPRQLTDRELCVEQIKRDVDTINDPRFIDDGCPGRAFYEERIARFKTWLKEMDSE